MAAEAMAEGREVAMGEAMVVEVTVAVVMVEAKAAEVMEADLVETVEEGANVWRRKMSAPLPPLALQRHLPSRSGRSTSGEHS